MVLCTQTVSVPADPREVARRLSDADELFFLWSADGSGPSYVAIQPVEFSRALDPEPALPTRNSDSPHAHVPRWIGLLPYESQRQLERTSQRKLADTREVPHVQNVSWWRFDAVVCIDKTVTVVGEDPQAVAALSARLVRTPSPAKPSQLRPLPGEPLARHYERIWAAQARIAAGDIYQVNLARRIEVEVEGETLDLLDSLCRDTRPPFALALRCADLQVLSTSPELFLRQYGEREVETIPIKGTRPRSPNGPEDARLARELEYDPKERAELSMIIDVERNDLGKIASFGSVEVPEAPGVFSSGLVWHRRARVVARCASGVGRHELLEALLPSGSVTGAPKVRAMEIIAELESQRRGLYTGAMGFIDHCGRLCLSMAIRTLTVRSGVGHYFAGGGIVADSDPELEVRETEWKSRQLIAQNTLTL